MNLIKQTLFAAIFAGYSSSVISAIDTIEFTLLPAANPTEVQAKKAIEKSEINGLLADLAQQYFPFEHTLTVQYGGNDGPLYDPASHIIHIPYDFYTQSLNAFINNDYQEKFARSAQLGALDTLLHTLLHEAGHAYIEDQNIPILGREEDAADNFAAVIMIDYIEDGANAAISAADMFAFESQLRPDYYDWGEYIGEHSFDMQRYFATLCLVYGSDPKRYASLLDKLEKEYLNERKAFCSFQFSSMRENWHQYLMPSPETTHRTR
ncbi:DUF4344 domain-containing metallopeptidase [Vibrio renipiscarius]|uniref:DUF4344 domain-containing metallopeptidase n=1 Tax=Vibrio renipiscarius TaxID=1461322 RepID=UPI003554513D